MARRVSTIRDVRNNALDKASESTKMSKVYTTIKINQILEDIKKGKKPDLDPFYHGKKDLRDTGITFEKTEEEEEEYRKCAVDIIYFVSNYVKFKNDKGFTLVKLRDYQEDFLHMLGDEIWDDKLQDVRMKNRRCISMQSRQTGKSTTVVSYFAWFMLFHADRQLLITANKESTTKEILKKAMDVFKALPYFLKPGIEEYSKTTLRIENGSSLRAVATTGDSATGDSINILLIDECALIPQNIIKEFWASVYPTMSSFEQSQIIVLSTPRGRQGLFYDLYSGAINGTNGFVYKRVDWWQVPGHDEKWKDEQISVFGQDLWDREFALSFDTQESRLLTHSDFQYLDEIKVKFINVDIYGIPKRVTDKIFWHPDFHPDELTYEDKLKRRFVCIIDTAEGTEKGEFSKEDADYNIINIFEMKLLEPETILKNRLGYKAVKYMNVIKLEQVGIYIDHNFDEEECAAAAQHIAFDLFSNGSGYEGEIDNMKILYEKNFNGKNFLNIFKKHDMYYESILNGFLTVSGNHGKKYFCELGAKLIGLRQIIVSQDHETPVMSTIEQLKSFGKVKNSYAGLSTHDDIAITVLFASRFFDAEEKYFEWLDEWFGILPQYITTEEERNQINTIFTYLEKYEYTKDDEQEDDPGEIAAYAAQGFGQLTMETQGTYGSLYNQNIDYTNYQTYNGLKNPITQTRFLKNR